ARRACILACGVERTAQRHSALFVPHQMALDDLSMLERIVAVALTEVRLLAGHDHHGIPALPGRELAVEREMECGLQLPRRRLAAFDIAAEPHAAVGHPRD